MASRLTAKTITEQVKVAKEQLLAEIEEVQSKLDALRHEYQELCKFVPDGPDSQEARDSRMARNLL